MRGKRRGGNSNDDESVSRTDGCFDYGDLDFGRRPDRTIDDLLDAFAGTGKRHRREPRCNAVLLVDADDKHSTFHRHRGYVLGDFL